MKKLLIAASFAFGLCAAHAQMYGELGYSASKSTKSIDGERYESSPSSLRAILGYELHTNLAVEALLGLAQQDAGVKLNGAAVQGARSKNDSLFGLYLKPRYALTPELEVFGRLGYARAKITNTDPGPTVRSETHSGTSYGVGLSYALTPSVFLTTDYMRYISKSQVKGTGYTIGIGYQF